jgi:hypothetical protein
MAKDHGARQQKRMAKQKAKRSAKRSLWSRLNSKDPTVRLRQVDKLPVVQTLVGSRLWDDGIGYLAIARQESTGGVIFAVFLVDVFCLGVKNAYWRAGGFDELVGHMEKSQRMAAIAPACLAKIVKGAVEYAQSFGFPPHPDYRHASILLDGIDTADCPNQFKFGRDGRPYYIQGPNESLAQAEAISQRIEKAGGHFLFKLSGPDPEESADTEDGFEQFDPIDADDSSDESL